MLGIIEIEQRSNMKTFAKKIYPNVFQNGKLGGNMQT